MSKEALIGSIELLKESDIVNELVVYAENLEVLWADFKSHYKTIRAAGGVVIKDNQALMIFKNGHWDLPKGKIDGSESIEAAAVREVKEECGLTDLSVEKEITITHYLFQNNGELHLKETSWFLMSSATKGPLVGDEKEGITDVKWMDKQSWEEVQKISYPSIINTLSLVF